MNARPWLPALCLIPISLSAQSISTGSKVPPIPDAALDPTRSVASWQLESAIHTPLPEQYIWTREDAVPDKPDLKGNWTSEGNTDLDSHYFRRAFSVSTLPSPFFIWGDPARARCI